MKVITQYDTQLEIWQHNLVKDFMGQNKDRVSYILGITPPDPNDPICYYFNIWVERKYSNQNHDVVFHSRTYTCFKVKHNNHVPSVEFFFDLIEKAFYEFAKIFHTRTRHTNPLHHKTPKPRLEDLKEYIQKCIDTWDKTIRNMSMN